MRAQCEACSRPQPPDWRAGDLCVWCGQAVRREVRCFWCAKWTPALKYCRHCGAATVAQELYGAARMLKDAGTDRFTIPRFLKEFDPEQIENFSRIYARHAAVAAQHVDHIVWLQQHLCSHEWSAEAEDQLAAELPWPDARLTEMESTAGTVNRAKSDVERARTLQRSSPLPQTRSLAVMVRLALDDWDAAQEVACLLSHPEERMRAEAAIALGSWRVLRGPGLPGYRRELIEELRRSPFREAAAVRLALLGEKPEMALPSGEFASALVNGSVDLLTAAARRHEDELTRYAAADRLIDVGALAPVGDALLQLNPEHQVSLLSKLDRRRKPVPELRRVLKELAANTEDRSVHRRSCDLLALGCPAEEAVQVAQLARGESGVYQALFQRGGLSGPALEQLCTWLIEKGEFSAEQWGLKEAIPQFPLNFVQRHWPSADSATRAELCRFAELQLGHGRDADLHRFLVDAALTPGEGKVQETAWTCLYRWYDSFGYPRWRPLAIEAKAIEEQFGSTSVFLRKLRGFLWNSSFLHDVQQRDRVAPLLRYADENVLPLLEEHEADTRELIEALAGVMRDRDADLIVRQACVEFLGLIGQSDLFRDGAIAVLRPWLRTDLGVVAGRMLERWK